MKIGYSKKITKNLGNYESLVIKINVEEDLQDKQTADELFYKLKDFVNAKIQEDLASYNQKNSTVEVKKPEDKTDTKVQLILDELRKKCILLVGQNENNRSKIKSLLSDFKVSKIMDLNVDNILLFKSKLEAL
jgi:hypothetical protein